MPTYEARCQECGVVQNYVQPMKNARNSPLCHRCGGRTRQIIRKAPMGFVKGGFAAFRSPVDGSLISTDRGLAEHNKRNDVVNLHDGYSEDRVVSGSYTSPAPKENKQALVNDIQEAIYKTSNGYLPTRETMEND